MAGIIGTLKVSVIIEVFFKRNFHLGPLKSVRYKELYAIERFHCRRSRSTHTNPAVYKIKGYS